MRTMDHACTIWMTGLSGAGKSTLARLLERRFLDDGARVEVLDGDEFRAGLAPDLGYSRSDRDENVRRMGYLCRVLCRQGVITIVAAISPYRAAREAVRASVPTFIEVYVQCPLPVLVERDPKGLYRRALAGTIAHFTGVSDHYEPPVAPEIVVRSDIETPDYSAAHIYAALEQRGAWRPVRRSA